MSFNCPGQEKRKLTIETLLCKQCGSSIEFFSDEVRRRCSQCKSEVTREVLPTCIDWCRYVKECVGGTTFDKYMADKGETIKEQLIKELEEYFSNDSKRIAHAKRVMQFAQDLLKEEGGDWHIVIPASVLHDVGIKIAEEKHGSTAGHHQEKEGPAIAKKILLKAGFQVKDIDEICTIIAHHHAPGKVDTQNFKVLYDADWLVNLQDEVDTKGKDELQKLINKIFLTSTGKKIARQIYIDTNN
ncbi:HD domain-containing protein [Candidatus Omnitrophota bacterium]